MPDNFFRISVQLPGSNTTELLRVSRVETQCVGDLKVAVMAWFNKRFQGLDPSEVQLYKLDGTSRIMLEPTHTLCEAGIVASTKIAVEVAAASHTSFAYAGV